jgi:hypothetical protein
MGHARINLQRMLDWIETCLRNGTPLPNDAAICEKFGFDTTEAARTLLAELADAGKITIKGYGPTRTIGLGRVRSTLPAMGRVRPPVAKVDHEIERGAARLAQIMNRDRSARAVVAENAGRLLAIVTPAPAPEATVPSKKDTLMPAKTISLPASAVAAIEAIEALAKREDLALGHAAAILIERGADRPVPVVKASSASPEPLSIEVLLDLLRERIAAKPDHSADLAAAIARADAADVRAKQAEEKLSAAKALFA